MPKLIQDLNKERKSEYYKNPEKENFLEEFNDALQGLEKELYQPIDIDFPFIFTFGPPRSGTTLITQLVSYCLDVGYINNFVARFWKAPVCGIKLSQMLLEESKVPDFKSKYGSTNELNGVHEFGYFWRHWLEKYSMESIKNSKLLESELDWKGLKVVLANIQDQFKKPVLMKNILGSYHLEKISTVLEKVIYVYIERDPIDTAVSILDARKKYYDDLNNWWSYVPPQYEKIINEDYWTQIAGQVLYLKRFYEEELSQLDEKKIVKVNYNEVCQNPRKVLEKIKTVIEELYSIQVNFTCEPPKTFRHHVYNDREEEKNKFQEVFEQMRKGEGYHNE